MEVAEGATYMPLGCCGQALRAMKATPNQPGDVPVVAQRIEKPGAVTGFS
jgi:hypothetical protein